ASGVRQREGHPGDGLRGERPVRLLEEEERLALLLLAGLLRGLRLLVGGGPRLLLRGGLLLRLRLRLRRDRLGRRLGSGLLELRRLGPLPGRGGRVVLLVVLLVMLVGRP